LETRKPAEADLGDSSAIQEMKAMLGFSQINMEVHEFLK
jgi:hypothetical protein